MKTLLYYVAMNVALGKDIVLSTVVQRSAEKEDGADWQRLSAVSSLYLSAFHPRLTYNLSCLEIIHRRTHDDEQKRRMAAINAT